MSNYVVRAFITQVLFIFLTATGSIAQESKGYLSEFGEYIYLKDHPKSKGVNMGILVPNGWEIEEALRQTLVMHLTDGDNYLTIAIEDMVTFLSKDMGRRYLADDRFEEGILKLSSSMGVKMQVISKEMINVDSYPCAKWELIFSTDNMGEKYEYYGITWYIAYEDMLITLSGNCENGDCPNEREIYDLILWSITFLDRTDLK
jgi:hypothetical protein